jgi:hypothetical protein
MFKKLLFLRIFFQVISSEVFQFLVEGKTFLIVVSNLYWVYGKTI